MLTRLNSNMRAKLLVLSAIFIFSAATCVAGGADKFPTEISMLRGNSAHVAVSPDGTHISLSSPEQLQLATPQLIASISDSPECVLPKNASTEQYSAFSNCITSTNCQIWSRQVVDDISGIAVRLKGSECVGPSLLCVLSGGASESEVQEFEACKRKKSCADEWKEFVDEDNGNVALICEEGQL